MCLRIKKINFSGCGFLQLLVDDTVILQVCTWLCRYMTQGIYTKQCLRVRLVAGAESDYWGRNQHFILYNLILYS